KAWQSTGAQSAGSGRPAANSPSRWQIAVAPWRRVNRFSIANPFQDLLLRRRSASRWAGFLQRAAMAIFVVMLLFSFGDDDWFAFALLTLFGMHGAIKFVFAFDATRALNEDKRSSALELLLTTPLHEQKIAKGVASAFQLQFSRHVKSLFALTLAAQFVAIVNPELRFRGDDFIFVSSFLWAPMIWTWSDYRVVAWIGMSHALKENGHTRAMLRTLGEMVALPWLPYFTVLFWMASTRVEELAAAMVNFAWAIVGAIYQSTKARRRKVRVIREFRSLISSKVGAGGDASGPLERGKGRRQDLSALQREGASLKYALNRMKRIWVWLVLAAAVCGWLAQSSMGAAPNVVLIYADDLGYADIGAFGATNIATPNLNRLAREGRKFTSFYVAQPVCSASRAALLTGCYPNRVGIAGALGPKAKVGINKEEMTLAELVKQQRYATAIFGKWHLGHHPEFLPTRHGFDEYYGLPYSNDMWPQHPEAKPGTYPDLPLIGGELTLELNPDQTQLTKDYTKRATKFIERNKERPFFLYLAHSMPHVPLYASEDFRGKSRAGLYGDVIEEIDWSVGEVMRALEEHALAENTLVIFTSDNGPWLSYGNHSGTAGELREGKGTVWEGGVRVPCIMRWPGRIPANTACDEPAMTIDLFPTIAALVGAELPEHRIDGKNIWPLIEGARGAKSPQEGYFFYYNANDLLAVRSGEWKLVVPHEYRTLNGKPGGTNGIPTRYVNVKTDLALYNLEKDLGEAKNVAKENPAVVERLNGLLEKMRVDLGDNLQKVEPGGARAPGRVEE
ncbi:MAG: sulfatase family protein, partial [Limisphaerales bacterium]